MAITNFKWNNGTVEHPVPLSSAMIDKLLAAGDNGSIDMEIGGYFVIEYGGTLPKGTEHKLSTLFPDLHFEGSTSEDVFTVTADGNVINEGGEVNLICSNNDIDINDLNFEITFGTFTTSTGITEEEVRSRISIDKVNKKIKVSTPNDPHDWSIEFSVRVSPVWDSSNVKDVNYNNATTFTARAVKPTQVTITSDVYAMDLLSSNTLEFTVADSSGHTKTVTHILSASLNGANWVVPFNETTKKGTLALPSGAAAGTIIVSVTTKVGNTGVATGQRNYIVEKPTEVIINQNGSISSPLNMVINKTDIENELSNPNSAIRWIRDNSHCYLGKFKGGSIGMEVQQLSDGDRNKLADGVTNSNIVPTLVDNVPQPDSDGYYKEVFMNMPTFYYITESDPSDVDIIHIKFAKNDFGGKWHKWEGMVFDDNNNVISGTLIGTYQATLINSKIYSISNATVKDNYSYNNFSTAASSRSIAASGMRFTLVNYQLHCVMALLYYAYYGYLTMNCQDTVEGGLGGAYDSYIAGKTGVTNALGMSDGKGSENSAEVDRISFWGLEDWWGHASEFISGASTANSTGLISVYDDKGNRTVQTGIQGYNNNYCVRKFVFGDGADLLSRQATSTTDFGSYYCDAASVISYAGYVGFRSGSGSAAGVGCLRFAYAAAYAGVGSRLLYKGKTTGLTAPV